MLTSPSASRRRNSSLTSAGCPVLPPSIAGRRRCNQPGRARGPIQRSISAALSDTLSAADMDRWMGPRARPGWLQRLLPAMLGGSTGQPADVSELLRRLDAEGDVSIDEFALEKLKLKQLRGHASLRALRLQMEKCQAQWAGGALQASVTASFEPK